jgi:membrane dipeptidase
MSAPRVGVVALVFALGCGANRTAPEPTSAEATEAHTAAETETPTEAEAQTALEAEADIEPATTTGTEADRTADPARTLVVIDTHCDTTQRLLDERADLTQRLPDGHLDFPRMREGGLTAAFMSIWVDPRRYAGEAGWARAQALVRAVRDFVAAHPEQAVLATTASEVRQAAAEGRIALLMGLEGAHGLGDAEPEVLLARLAELATDGVRYVTLTWTNDNVFGHASTGAHPGRGLTEEGRALVRRMNDLGMIVDVSHVSDRTALDALSVTRAPVLASHSGARAVGDHPRNLPDTVLRRIADNGGAVCVNYYAAFVDPAYGEARRAVERAHRAEFDALPNGRSWSTSAARTALVRRLAPELRPPTLRTLGAHFAHVASITGPLGICLGSDFDGVGELPQGLDDVSDLPALLRELERRRLDVRLAAGENVLRVMEAVEAAARR